jgi:hypothetical protein
MALHFALLLLNSKPVRCYKFSLSQNAKSFENF